MKVFISHSTTDANLAGALRNLLGTLFEDLVDVKFSSDTKGSGIDPGANWFNWIVEQVTTADHTLVVVTPESVLKPWPWWESGAVAGVALGKGRESSVIPVVYRMPKEQVPSPLNGLQVVSGENAKDMSQVIQKLNRSLQQHLPEGVMRVAFEAAFRTHLQEIQSDEVSGPDAVRRLKSGYATADIRIDQNKEHDKAQRMRNSVFEASSEKADKLFHVDVLFPDGNKTLCGRPIYEVLSKLEPLIEPDQWLAVAEEQQGLETELLKYGNPLPAFVPLVFRDGEAAKDLNIHPDFRGRAYLGMIVEYTQLPDAVRLRMLYNQVPTCLRSKDRHRYCVSDILAGFCQAASAADAAGNPQSRDREPACQQRVGTTVGS
jgi:hypothetical protein